MYISGYVNIAVEGFFVERFINICISKGIILLDLQRQRSTILKAKIIKSDFKKIRHIAKKTKCKVSIDKKTGIPFLLNKYRKRKILAIAILAVAIFIFGVTRFVWNIEVIGLQNIPEEEIISMVKDKEIETGKLKSNIETQKIINQIRLERDDLAWIGIEVKGTNVIISVVEAIIKPDIIDKNEVCNIVSDKDAIISKIVVQNGTARVAIGDDIKVGDILVEGVMEGQYTGNRYVHAEADIYANIYYEKERKESFIQEVDVKTGNEEKKVEISMNNFKINFNKGVSKFENYDTIRTCKKLKLFSNYYLPIEIAKITNIETQKEYKTYSEEELKEKITKELEEEIEVEFNISSFENAKKEIFVEQEEDGVKVKLVYEVQEKIGTEEK